MSDDTRLDWRACLPLGPRGWLWRTSGFSAAEVRRLLGEDPPGPRAQAIRRCVAHASDWFPPEDFVHCPWYYRRHLTRIVFWSTRGLSPEAISRRLVEDPCHCLGSGMGPRRGLPADCGLPQRGSGAVRAVRRPVERRAASDERGRGTVLSRIDVPASPTSPGPSPPPIVNRRPTLVARHSPPRRRPRSERLARRIMPRMFSQARRTSRSSSTVARRPPYRSRT